MPSYVIGLDLGQRSVKAAVLKSAFRGYEIEDFLSLDVESVPEEEEDSDRDLTPRSIAPIDSAEGEETVGEDTESEELPPPAPVSPVLKAAQRVLETINLPQAVVVVSLPSTRVSSWVVEFPFSDPKRVEKTVEFEVENYVPWDLDEVVFDHSILPGPGPGARVLTAMAPRETVAETLEGFRAIGLEPLHLATDMAELARLLPADDECDVIVDLGASRTLLCVVHEGQAIWVRCLDSGTSSFGATGEGREGWLGQLRSSLLSAELGGAPSIDRVHLCGGAARHEGLVDAVEAELGVPTSTLVLPESPRGSETAPQPVAEHALAYALALKGFASRSNLGICFRKGAFAHKAAGQLNARLAMLAVAAVILLSVGLVTMHFVKLSGLKADLEERSTRLASTILVAFPEVSPGALATSDGAISVLQEQVTTLQWRVQALEGPENTPLALLRELSNSIPGTLVVDLDEYLVNSEVVRIRGETDSFGSVDQIEAAILEKEMFRGAKKSDVNKSRDGRMRFVVTVPRAYEGEEVEG